MTIKVFKYFFNEKNVRLLYCCTPSSKKNLLSLSIFCLTYFYSPLSTLTATRHNSRYTIRHIDLSVKINSKKYSNSEVSVRGRAAPQVITMTLYTIYSVVFLTNLVTACKKAENPFEKRIPHFRLDTENFGDRDFYDCTELHKARMDP